MSILGLTLASLSSLYAQISITQLGNPYNQDFDGLGNTTINNAFSSTIGTQTDINTLSGVTGMNGWYGVKNAGTGSTATALTADTGASASGGIYSYGATPVTDRALGVLASGTNIMTIGALFQNDTGSVITDLVFNFTAEFWRSSTSTQNVLTFGYGNIGGTITVDNFLTDSGATAFTGLDITGPAAVSTNGALDGNQTANQLTFTNVTINGLSIANGSQFFIRWADTNDSGNDAGLAIDNFSMTAIPEPSTYAMILGALVLGLGLIRRRK